MEKSNKYINNKYGLDLMGETVNGSLLRIINQVYRLLPVREEGQDWHTPLDTIIVEMCGMYNILIDNQDTLFQLLNKLEGLKELVEERKFHLYRRTIFDCINLIKQTMEEIENGSNG